MSNYINANSVPYQDLLNEFFATKPKEVDGIANSSAFYYRQRLLQMILARFEFKNLPDTWDLDYLLMELFISGHICVTDTDMGVLPLRCGLTGIGVYNEPTTCIIANPILGNFERRIHEDCEIIRIKYDYLGISRMLDRYSCLLAMCDSSIAVNLMNTKLAIIFGATSKAQANTFKKLYDQIAMGKPAVFTSEAISAQMKENIYQFPVKNQFIADDVQLLKRKIINEFLTEIGVNNTNLDKRERLTDDEVNANNDEVLANIKHWYDNIKEGVNRVNNMYKLGIDCTIVDYDNVRSEIGGDIDESAKLD